MECVEAPLGRTASGTHGGSVTPSVHPARRLTARREAHDDAVAAVRLLLPPHGLAQHAAEPLLATASWDCSVKLWR
jgi:hypothetical protein